MRRMGLLLALAAIGGCRPPAGPADDAVQDVAERGPLKLTVAAHPREPQIGDLITVDLSVETPAEHEVRFPDPNDFGDLAARAGDASDPRPGAQGLVWRRRFSFDALRAGPLEIPPLTVNYSRRSAGADTPPAAAGELTSNTLKLDVRSALTKEDQPTQPRDITGTLLPPVPPMPLWVRALWVVGIVVLLAAASLTYRAVRRRLLRPPPPILPEVWALRALAELDRLDWFALERIREYYYRLTEIVRRYIELKFGLAAPEMTTEEFLESLRGARGAVPYDADRLGAFLEACDFVKYAALRPRREEAQSVLATARAFVDATAAAGRGSDAVARGGTP